MKGEITFLLVEYLIPFREDCYFHDVQYKGKHRKKWHRGLCHRFSKSDVRSKSKKIIVRFVNRKNCNKFFENKEKLAKLNSEKHNFREGTKIFC